MLWSSMAYLCCPMRSMKTFCMAASHVSIAELGEEIRNLPSSSMASRKLIYDWLAYWVYGIRSRNCHDCRHAIPHNIKPHSISQWAAVEAINGDQTPVQDMLVQFAKRRELMLSLLNNIDGIECVAPDGAFYASQPSLVFW